MNIDITIPAEVDLELVHWPFLEGYGVELAVLRLDKTDKFISGNKWFKLHYHVQQALAENKQGLISVGGPHSNHLHALAAKGRQLELPTVGLIRGEPKDTPTILDLKAMGMSIHWLSYGEFRARYQPAFWNHWLNKYKNFYNVPEGGTGVLGAKGCYVIPQFIQSHLAHLGWSDYDQLYVSVGTGSTFAGIIWGDQGKHDLFGCLATPLKFGVPLQVEELLAEIPCYYRNYGLLEAARKGFGQVDGTLLAFMAEIEQLTPLLLDPVYTAKTLFLIYQRVKEGVIKRHTKVIFVHTGGLQGRRALVDKRDALFI